jgi:zinc D-Ala-D-Ala carboxypeptidase
MKLSKNFTVKEYTKSSTAIRRGFSNSMTAAHLESAKALFENIIQPVRDHFGSTVITSGYRSDALNDAIGGSRGSQHSKAEAGDFETNSSTLETAQWIADNLDFDQLILEFYIPGDPNSGWTHCSYVSKAENRNQILTAVKRDGKTVYLNGIVV